MFPFLDGFIHAQINDDSRKIESALCHQSVDFWVLVRLAGDRTRAAEKSLLQKG